MSPRSGSLALVACMLACTPKQATTNVTDDPAKARADGARAGAVAAPEREGQIPERMTVRVSVRELDDLIEAIQRVSDNWNPPAPGAPGLDVMALVSDTMIQGGLGPGAIEALDLGGLHVVEVDIPHERYGRLPPDNIDLRASLATNDPRRILLSLPPEIQPEELGEGRWRLAEDQVTLLAEAKQGVLALATGQAELDAAYAYRQTRAEQRDSPRLHIELLNPDPEAWDLAEMFAEVPGLDEQTLDLIAAEGSLDLDVDFGTERDFAAHASVLAPFGDKAFAQPATTGPSPLATILPPEPLFVVQLALGETSEQMLRALAGLSLPDSATNFVDTAMRMAALGNELILAAYYDSRGRVSIVLATELRDPEAIESQLPEWERQTVDQFEAGGLQTSLKVAGLNLGSRKADLVQVRIPDTDDGRLARQNHWLFRSSKPELEVALLLAGDALIVSAGAGSREVLKTINKRVDNPRSEGIDGYGLSRARELTSGCHACAAVHFGALLDAALDIIARKPGTEPEVVRNAKALRADLRALDLGEIALAARWDPDSWHIGLGAANSVYFTDAAKIREVVDALGGSTDTLSLDRTPSEREICEHVLDVAKRSAPVGNPEPSADDMERATAKCSADLVEEHERLGDEVYEAMVECVMAADSMEAIIRCDTSD